MQNQSHHPPSVHWIDSTSDLPLLISARTRRRAPSTGHPSCAYEQTPLVQWTFYRTGGFGTPTQPRSSKTPKVRDGYFLVVNGAYVPELFEEMQGFPTGKFKDQTDAFAGAYLELVLPTSKAQMLTIAQGAGAQSIPEAFRSDEGKCRNRACERPAFEADGYCCDCCRRVAPQAEAPERHHPECNVKFNDWWVKKG